MKILSSHLVFLSLFLIVLDYKRLLNLLVMNRPAMPLSYLPYFENFKLEKAKNIVKWLLVTAGLGFAILGSVQASKNYGTEAKNPPLYGLYEVEVFVRNGDTIPPLMTDSSRWKRLIVERKDIATLHVMGDQKKWYDFKPDSLENFVLLNLRKDTSVVDTLSFSEPDSSRFILEGRFEGNKLKVSFLKKRKEDFLLRSRGFKWVNEYPFNR